jgi:hypothetical protein
MLRLRISAPTIGRAARFWRELAIPDLDLIKQVDQVARYLLDPTASREDSNLDASPILLRHQGFMNREQDSTVSVSPTS